jgi:hypothetical protein
MSHWSLEGFYKDYYRFAKETMPLPKEKHLSSHPQMMDQLMAYLRKKMKMLCLLSSMFLHRTVCRSMLNTNGCKEISEIFFQDWSLNLMGKVPLSCRRGNILFMNVCERHCEERSNLSPKIYTAKN